MMVRVCKNCGATTETKRYYCRECGTEFDLWWVACCQKWLPKEQATKSFECKVCSRARKVAWQKKNRARHSATSSRSINRFNALEHARYSKLVEEQKKRMFKPLSEEQWSKACDYFNGCAICAKPIEKRALVVPAKEGGRYCVYNVIPLCVECSTKGVDFFAKLVRCDKSKKEAVDKIYDYFREVLDEYPPDGV